MLLEKTENLLFDFIEANIKNELGEYMFMTSSGMFEVEEQKKILDMASEEYKASDNVQRIIARIEAVEKLLLAKTLLTSQWIILKEKPSLCPTMLAKANMYLLTSGQLGVVRV